jgi:hypothetical protein
MSASTATRPSPTSSAAVPAPRWPYHGRDQRHLLIAAVIVLLGAVTPWVETVVGTVLGVQGGGMYTLAAGGMGLAGALYRRRWVVLTHGVVLAVTPLLLSAWQVSRLVALGCDFRVCAPSYGLVLTVVGAGLATRAVVRLLRGSTAQPPTTAGHDVAGAG